MNWDENVLRPHTHTHDEHIVAVSRESRFLTRTQLTGSQQPGCKHFVHSLLCCYIKDGVRSVSLSAVMPSVVAEISHWGVAEVDFSQVTDCVCGVLVYHVAVFKNAPLVTMVHITALLRYLCLAILHNKVKNCKWCELTFTHTVQFTGNLRNNSSQLVVSIRANWLMPINTNKTQMSFHYALDEDECTLIYGLAGSLYRLHISLYCTALNSRVWAAIWSTGGHHQEDQCSHYITKIYGDDFNALWASLYAMTFKCHVKAAGRSMANKNCDICFISQFADFGNEHSD